MSDNNSLGSEIVKQIPVKEIYNDLLHPALSEVGKGLQGAVKLALSPITGLIWGYDKLSAYLDAAIPEYFAQRKINKENIKTPDVSIAVPTIEAMRYVSDKVELRNMFVNLLGAAMNNETAEKVHPAYVDIIKQLSTKDAKCLNYLRYHRKALIDYEIDFNSFSISDNNCIDVSENYKTGNKSSINNLIRLGIFEKIKTNKLSSFEEFEHLEDIIFEEIILDYKKETGIDLIINHTDRHILQGTYYWLTLTNFGKYFVDICCEDYYSTSNIT
jgi:hypothetical protein